MAAESFYKAPAVIVITGNTNRRLHTLSVCANTLAVNGYAVESFSFSLDKKELAKLQQYELPAIQSYSHGVFMDRYKAHEAPSHTKSFLLIEMDIDVVKDFKFADHKVRTIVFTDVFMKTKDGAEELMEAMHQVVKKASSLNTILSNDDVDREDTDGMYYLPLDMLSVRNHKTYGTTNISSYVLEQAEHDLSIREGKAVQKYHVPFFSKFSRIKQEGIEAALAMFLVEGIQPTTFMPQGFPLIEKDINEHVEYYWMGEETTEEEVHAILDVAKDICVGVSVYLSFENIIEEYVEKLGSILVVAENIAEATLFTEYFVKKEKNSFYSIVYASKKEDLKYLIPPLFEGHKVVYMFGEIDSFKEIK